MLGLIARATEVSNAAARATKSGPIIIQTARTRNRAAESNFTKPYADARAVSVRESRGATGDRSDSFGRRYCQRGNRCGNQTRRAQFERARVARRKIENQSHHQRPTGDPDRSRRRRLLVRILAIAGIWFRRRRLSSLSPAVPVARRRVHRRTGHRHALHVDLRTG